MPEAATTLPENVMVSPKLAVNGDTVARVVVVVAPDAVTVNVLAKTLELLHRIPHSE